MVSPVLLLSDSLYTDLERELQVADTDTRSLYHAIANAPFDHDRDMALLFLGFISFFVLDEEKQAVVTGSFTDNEYFQHSVADHNFDPTTYKLPLSLTDNALVKAITTGKPVSSDNWDNFKRPEIEEGIARLNQAAGGIGYSVVYPVAGKIKGALIFNYYQFPESIGDLQSDFMARYSNLVSSALA